MGHDQLVGVALLLRQRRSALNALRRIWNGAIQRGPAGTKSKSRDHHAGIAEHQLRLDQSLAFHATHEAVGVNVDIVKRQRGSVAQTNAMLVLGLVVSKALGALRQQ